MTTSTILARLNPADAHVVAICDTRGDRWEWHTPQDEALERARETRAERKLGCTFIEAEQLGFTQANAFIDAMGPTVQELYRRRFGDPVALFGSAPGYGGQAYAEAAANLAWQDRCSDKGRLAA